MRCKILPAVLPVLLLFLFLTAASVKAQPFYGAISAGMNLSQVDGDEVYGFNKIGFNGGPSVIWPFGKNKKMSLTMELLYSQMGAYRADTYSNIDTIKDTVRYYDGYRLKLNYVQVPLMFHYTDKGVIAGGFGLLYGQLVGVSEWEDHNDERGFAKIDSMKLGTPGYYKKYDLQILADVRIRLYKRLWFDIRYSYSLIPIRNRTFENPFTHKTWERKQYNNVIALRLTYILNEPLPVKSKKKNNPD
ncbi:MAG: porin family protein [Syntrophothermus sp.]